MTDDEAGDLEGNERRAPEEAQRMHAGEADIFGNYSVVGSGVQIVLDGRAVSIPNT